MNGAQLVYDANSSTGEFHKDMNFKSEIIHNFIQGLKKIMK